MPLNPPTQLSEDVETKSTVQFDNLHLQTKFRYRQLHIAAMVDSRTR
jgi:hypothetical protein